MGVNAAGLSSKFLTFNEVLEELKPPVFLVEETKLKDAGRIKVENYVVFEKVRENRDRGGGKPPPPSLLPVFSLGCVKNERG